MIYFKNPNTTNLDTLLLSFFVEPTKMKSFFKRTYHDKDCTIEECHSARRSFKDIVKVMNTYIECTDKEVAHALRRVNNICCYKCNQIQKYVFHINNESVNCFHGTFPKKLVTCDYFYFTDYLKLLGI